MLRFRSAEPRPSAATIARLRGITGLSISDIRNRAAQGEPLIEIVAFRGDWKQSRALLVQLAEGIEDGSLPLTVAEVSENSEAPVSPQVLRNLIQSYRQIELETQADTELELGEISSPGEFQPYDEDWTQ